MESAQLGERRRAHAPQLGLGRLERLGLDPAAAGLADREHAGRGRAVAGGDGEQRAGREVGRERPSAGGGAS